MQMLDILMVERSAEFEINVEFMEATLRKVPVSQI